MQVKCPECGKTFRVEDVIEEDVLRTLRESAKEENQKEFDERLRLVNEKEKANAEVIESLRKQSEELIAEMKTAKKERDEAKYAAQKELETEAQKIRREEAQKAEERSSLELKAMAEQLAQTRKSLNEAQARAAQGTGQQKGEALEKELETLLKEAFPLDDIKPVATGKQGADVSQSVRDAKYRDCGLILYECKNAHWQKSWLTKLKSDVRAAGASIGVLVATELSKDFGEIEQIDGHIWAVKPRLAIPFAAALRSQLMLVASAKRDNELKDEKMEYLYQFLQGPEFRSRIEALIEGYDKLQSELEKEKRAAKARWAQQEKAIRMMVDSTFGLYGDFQGMLGGELKQLALTHSPEKEISFEADDLLDELEFSE